MISINGIEFEPIPGVNYQFDYVKIATSAKDGTFEKTGRSEVAVYRTLCLTDLWFLLYFALGHTKANHKFVVDACHEVETGPESDVLDLWAREHFKTSILTIARTVQRILKNPERRMCILSYTRDTARVFFYEIRQHLESNTFLKSLFPDVLYSDPKNESSQWNNDGITVKRKHVYKEATLEPWGLTEGMPTGRHFDDLLYDDIETFDMATSPAIMSKLCENFDMSLYIGTDGGTRNVAGTLYHNLGPIVYIQGLKKPDGSPMFHVRTKAGTHDGTETGRLVLVSEERNELLKANPRHYASQFLLDLTAVKADRLEYSYIKHVKADELPSRMYKLMVVDPSGGKREDGRVPDSWAIWMVGVDPHIQDVGISKIYILDGFVAPVPWDEGIKETVSMYLRHGWVHRLGIEKVGQSSFEVHVSNALRAKGRVVNIENGMMKVLKPEGRKKHDRIEGNLAAPLKHGLVHMLDTVPVSARLQLQTEMGEYPMCKKDDALDGLSYVWDLLREFQFGRVEKTKEEEKKDLWTRIREKRDRQNGSRPYSWMAA